MVGAALAGAAVAAGATFALTGDRPPPASAARILRITAEPGLEIHPALSPDGGFVAYAAGPTGRMRIYVRQLAGGRTVAVGESVKGDQHWPRWSPDGSRITFEADHAIYIAPALGGAVKALVPTPPEPPFADDEGPGSLAWSPDGERVAYVYERSIYVKPAAGGTPTRIVTVTPDPPHSLAWSPDGARIAFVLGNAAFVYSRNAIGNIAPSSIWLVRAEGGALTPVTDAAALNTSPVWMPDGGHLRFVSNRDGVRDVYEVEVRSAGAGRIRRITTGLLPHTIDVSRDGRVMVYGTFTDFANVWSLPVGSGAPAGVESARQVTVGHQSVEGLALSTDRRWLAFDSDRGGRQAIYRVSLEGGELEQLSGAEGDDFMPAWSPDGREIAYYGFRAGRRRLFVMPVDGGEPVPVVSDSGNQRFPDWSPDGRSLVFHSDHTGRFELFLVRRDAGGKWGPARQLTRDGGQEARWSPDGSAIVYVRGTGVWLVLPDGGQPRPLVDAADPATDPVPLLAQWAPDGRTVYYKALDRDGIATFWAVPAAGGRPRLVARLDDPARPSPRAEFATDGERLYFTIAERESDLWRMETAR
jgi:Tol biopolymer transport system component